MTYINDHHTATFGVGSYGGLDERTKRRGKKHPLGFSPPKPTPAPKKKRKAKA